MTFEVHAIVEHSPDLHLVVMHPVHKDVTRAMNRSDRLPDSVPTMPEMIGARTGGKFRTAASARTLGVLGNVQDCPGQESFIPAPHLFSELLMRPCEDHLDVVLSLRRQPIAGHQLLTARAAPDTLGRSPTDIADEVGKLPFAFENNALTAIK